MGNGYILLGIIALLFMSMYIYSHLSVFREKMAQNREHKKQLEKDELRRQRRILNQEIIQKRINDFNLRKEKIQHELTMLGKMNLKQKVS